MRQVHALLGLIRRHGNQRADETCRVALDVEVLSVKRFQRMLAIAPPARPPPLAYPIVVPRCWRAAKKSSETE